MAYTTEQPTVTASTVRGERDEINHPAYGVISVTHPSSSGKGTILFDSAIGHNDFVSIKVSSAQNNRTLNQNWIHEKQTLCEFYMSESQWAQLVASSGMGRGVPITFRYKPEPGYTMMTVPGIAHSESMKQTFDREIKKSCKAYVAEIAKLKAEVEALAVAGKANKTQLAKIAFNLGIFATNLPSNMAFTQTQFAEAMEQTTEQAKSDIEAFIVNLAMSTGLDVLRERNVQLNGTSDTPLTIEE